MEKTHTERVIQSGRDRQTESEGQRVETRVTHRVSVREWERQTRRERGIENRRQTHRE